jgi:hypothetical protein
MEIVDHNAFIFILCFNIYLRMCLCYEKVAASAKKTELTAGEIRCADYATPCILKSCH